METLENKKEPTEKVVGLKRLLCALPYIINPYFIYEGRECGLLSSEENILKAVYKNKLHNFLGKPTKYNDMFIWGYRDGMEESVERIKEIIFELKSSLPTYITFYRRAIAQIAGFQKALDVKTNRMAQFIDKGMIIDEKYPYKHIRDGYSI